MSNDIKKTLEQIATVEYQLATYKGEVFVNCNDHHSDDEIIGSAKAQVRRSAGSSLPMGYESWKVTDRRYL